MGITLKSTEICSDPIGPDPPLATKGSANMPYEKLELLIAGEFRGGSEGKTEPVINPATEEVLGEVPHASTGDLDSALAASADGFKVWRARTPLQRQAVMEKAA